MCMNIYKMNVKALKCFVLLSLILIVLSEEEATVEDEKTEELEEIDVLYVTPRSPDNAYLAESFDDLSVFDKRWVKSKAKKEGVDEDIAKYDGVWNLEEMQKDSLGGDYGLVLKSKAKHAAISSSLKKTFVFNDKPLVVQYEVNFQNGQECGGGYIKLLSGSYGKIDLKSFQEKTPYTIMFGPDKCGNDFKFHFIFRHVNPINKSIEEKHAKRPAGKHEAPFNDKRPHLYTLIVNPDNSYEILLDHQAISSGHLLADFTPPVNPTKEIEDPSDIKPEDWDEQEKIADSSASKPEDWDEDAPKQIIDGTASKPAGWLDDEQELIPDPEAVKPDDWDDDMDGEWEAPLVSNPPCVSAPGCGKWKPPLIDNPNYRGKWKAPMINNPNYKGKWTPKMIPNPDYYEDLEPFKMTSIGAIGLELWSMSDNIYFDNILITDSRSEASQFAQQTFDLKIAKIDKGKSGLFKQVMDFSNSHPWMYGVYVLVLAIPVVIIFACCCGDDSKDKSGEKKKTDEPTEDDPHVEEVEGVGSEGEEQVEEEVEGVGGEGEEQVEEGEERVDGEGEEQVEEGAERVEGEGEEEVEEGEKEGRSASEIEEDEEEESTRKSPRLRKQRKD